VSDPDPLRALPAISRLLETPAAAVLLDAHPRPAVVDALRQAVDQWRQRLQEGPAPDDLEGEVLRLAAGALLARSRSGLRPVINASGIIVHTNLGRSVLAESAARAAYEVARNYSNLEADLETGRRGSRQAHVASRIQELTGAPAAAVFNNNGAAVLLALAAIARGREVIVSRGQLVEIGGSFRIPEVIEQSGCILREVGATNRTHLRDYQRAINENTAAILRAHASNYRIIGFTSEPDLPSLVALAHEHGLPLVDDLGSGALLDMAALGLGPEPTLQQSLAAGADLVTFSGDKLPGGPQCGIVVGRPDLVEAMKRHPLARAIRVDKMVIAALAATLDLFVDPQVALREVPTLRAATEPLEVVRDRAQRLADALAPGLPAGVECHLHQDHSARVGGGSLPEQELETVSVRLPATPRLAAADLARALRVGDPSVYPRVEDDAVVLDARTLMEHQIAPATAAILAAVSVVLSG
jgi:L-seryl-tRNA(Ser) seleniumtransferase